MTRKTRKDDWGFPRWREYGSTHEAVKLRMCDRHGCDGAGTCPAPKAPNSPEKWWFCAPHAGEYNSGWNYFEGLSAEDAAAREADERRDASGYQESKHYGWAGPGDGSRSRDEMRALDLFDLETDVEFEVIKSAWRKMAMCFAQPRNAGLLYSSSSRLSGSGALPEINLASLSASGIVKLPLIII
jgi:hypothetical protein